MISTAHYAATDAGLTILQNGGNAADAAVAAAFALGVCEPAASGLGGQTMALVHEATSRKTLALDGSSCAPHRATPNLLEVKQRRRGHSASTVPRARGPAKRAVASRGSMGIRSGPAPSVRRSGEPPFLEMRHRARVSSRKEEK